MQESEPDAPEKPVLRIPRKGILILAGIVIAGILITAISAYILFQAPEKSSNPVIPSVTTSSSHYRVPATHYPTASQTTRIPSNGTVKITQNPVDFVLQPGEQTSCGLTCRQLDATITNSGYATAHNVCITVTLQNSRNEVIYLNGGTSIQRCIGDLSGGQSRTEPITINADCGIFATKCIGETLTLQTRVSSDEKTIRFPDQLIKV
jgi:hypothetical protein